jgi:hypothetical protein
MIVKPAMVVVRTMAARATSLSGEPRVSCPFCATSVPGWRIDKRPLGAILCGAEIADAREVAELRQQVESAGTGACPWCGEEMNEADLEAAISRVTLVTSLGRRGKDPWDLGSPLQSGTSLLDRLDADLYRRSSDTVSGSSLGTKR